MCYLRTCVRQCINGLDLTLVKIRGLCLYVLKKVHEFDFRFKSLSSIVKIKGIVQQFQPTRIHQSNTYAFFTLMVTKGYDVKKVLNAWGSDIYEN